MSEQLNRLGRQLDAIAAARTIAQKEPDDEKRACLLAAVNRARGAALEEYETPPLRPRFRLLKGGLGGAAIIAVAARTREHATAVTAIGAAAATTAIGATLLLGHPHNAPRTAAAPPPPAATSQPSPHTPQPSPNRAQAASQPGPAAGTDPAPPPVKAISAPGRRGTGANPLPGIIPELPLVATHLPAVPGVPSPPPSAPLLPPTGVPPVTAPTTPPPATPPAKGEPCLRLDLPPGITIGVCLLRHG